MCVEGCEKLCGVECGEKGECVKVEGEDDRCDCEEGYSYTGELCEANPTIRELFAMPFTLLFLLRQSAFTLMCCLCWRVCVLFP